MDATIHGHTTECQMQGAAGGELPLHATKRRNEKESYIMSTQANELAVEYAERIRELMLDNLFGVFSERDPDRRLEVINRNYTEDVIWTDPMWTAEGREAFVERAQEFVDGKPDVRFAAAGPVIVCRDLGYLAFNLGVPGQPPRVSGHDVALVRDGRIALLYTLIPGR